MDSPTRRVVCYCNNSDFGLTNVAPLLEGTDVVFEECSQKLIDRFGLTKIPTILFMKGDALVTKIVGKCMQGEMEKTLDNLQWR